MIKLKFVTPYGTIYNDSDIDAITIPTKSGIITIKGDHVPMLSIITPGEIQLDKGSHSVSLSVSKGVIDIRQNSVVYILADTAERAEEIDIERAEQARKRAEEFLKKQEDIADIDFARVQAQIEKELARINVARKYKKLPIDSRSL
ncbi:MAG TPA: ATP synthase F1 subunit epsilon [Candidatus Dojkabacteria bacterium]|jgi:F-type H+-transporting ATPase subunit epsilon